MIKCKALDHNGRRVVGVFVRYVDDYNVVIYAGGYESIFCLRSTLEFIK